MVAKNGKTVEDCTARGRAAVVGGGSSISVRGVLRRVVLFSKDPEAPPRTALVGSGEPAAVGSGTSIPDVQPTASSAPFAFPQLLIAPFFVNISAWHRGCTVQCPN